MEETEVYAALLKPGVMFKVGDQLRIVESVTRLYSKMVVFYSVETPVGVAYNQQCTLLPLQRVVIVK